jgi:hypothetical protein
MQLVWISIAFNVLVALCFGMFFMLSLRLPQDLRIPFSQKLPWLILLLLGVIGDALAGSALRKGIATERWPESLLMAPRKLLEHPVVPILGCSLFAASLAVAVFSRGQHIAESWFFLAPAMGLIRIQMSLRPQNKVAASSELLYPAKPLRSEQWGTPSQPFSD